MATSARPPDGTGSHTKRFLDAGLDGFPVPQVHDPESAAKAVQNMMSEDGRS